MKPKKVRYAQADYRRKFGNEVCSYFVVESAAHPGEVQINQYASRLIGPLTPAKARELAANLIAGADAVEVKTCACACHVRPDGRPNEAHEDCDNCEAWHRTPSLDSSMGGTK